MRDAETGVLGEAERAELEQLRQVVSSGPTALVAIDGAGLIRLWNTAATRLLGWPADETTGRRLTETVIPPELRAAHTAGMERYLRSGEPVVIGRPVTLPALHRDGHQVEVELTIWPSWVRGERHFYAFLRDTSEQRVAAERAARRTAVLLATIEAQRAVTSVAYDRDLALRVLAEHALAAFPSATGATVELLAGDELVSAAATGTLAGQQGRRSAVDSSLSGVAVTRRLPVRRGSFCVVPLLRGDGVIGVLTVAGDRPGVFDADDAHHLELLAGSLTSALVHADDFAQRTRAVEALEASETRFRLTFENSPLGLALASVAPDSFGCYLQTNPAMSAITGYRADELTRMTFEDLQHPADGPATSEALRHMLDQGVDTIRAEKRYLHKDGHTIWVSVRVAVVPDAEGVASCVVVQAEDVTAQRDATARLQQQAKLLELSPDAVIVRDLDGTIGWWNAGASELYGWSDSAARGKPTHRLLGTAFPNGGSVAELTAALTTAGRWEGQLQHLTATGRTLTVLSRQVLHQPTDGPAQVLEINTDVTAARAAEQALALNEQRFRAQFTHSAAGQVIRALDGTLIAVNRAFAAMLGRRPEDLAGHNVDRELLHPDDHAEMHHRVASLFAGEADSYTHEGRMRHADGHWVRMEATVSVVRDPESRPKHLIVVVIDISARRAAEQARDLTATALAERNTELEKANRLKLDMMRILGHEISNPLAAILGYSDLLADEIDAASAQGRAIGVIGRQVERLDDLVREMLAMVSIDTGNLQAVRQEVALRGELAKILLGSGAGTVPVTGPDAVVLFHPGHLQQIMANLLSNATKYAGGATGVTIEPAGDRVLIRLVDDGPGVPEDFRPRLFDRLTRADRDAGTKGTGLGLYIVRSLARANGGEVRHEPAPAGGSCFVIEAERAPAP